MGLFVLNKGCKIYKKRKHCHNIFFNENVLFPEYTYCVCSTKRDENNTQRLVVNCCVCLVFLLNVRDEGLNRDN